MEWTQEGLSNAGFSGFVPLSALDPLAVPMESGVYVVLRSSSSPPAFLTANNAGRLKGRDPAVPRPALEAAWVHGAAVLYIGKASSGGSRRRGLRKRLDEYRRYGAGELVSHWGGRYIWQLRDCDELLAAWRPTPAEDPEAVESALISNFVRQHGARPFANRKGGRRPSIAG